MEISKSLKSPWGQRVYFKSYEFDVMMDALREAAGPECFAEGKGIDVDLILLKNYQCDPDFVDLPENTLGRTRFAPDGNVVVQVSRQLADNAETDLVARKRLRTTLAHEIGHIACHQVIFLKDLSTLSLFPEEETDNNNPNSILCRESSVNNFKYSGEWWEYQANQCMAALLLPRKILAAKVKHLLDSLSLKDFEEAIRADRATNVIRDLCDQFDVSQQAMFYRLKEFGFIPNIDQTRMELSN